MSSPYFTQTTQHYVDALTADKLLLGIEDVFYGDQSKIPRTPAVTVQSGDMDRELKAVQSFTENTVRVIFMAYIGKLQDTQATQKQAEQFAETLVDYIDKDTTAGGNVIYGFVTRVEPGFTQRGGSIMRTARITWEGLTKKRIGV